VTAVRNRNESAWLLSDGGHGMPGSLIDNMRRFDDDE
jgi:hypothetical protein